jgi:FKBP12-rapamycin complex-associated protein
MNLYSDWEKLEGSLRLLSNRFEVEKATLDIRDHVEVAARELSLERFGRFENDLYLRISTLLYGNTIEEKLGAVSAIRQLVECTSAAAETKIIKFANILASILKTSTDFELIELIAQTLGHMARNSPIAHVDFVESELNRALEWLRGEQPPRKFAACSVLQQLAVNAPTVLFSRLKIFFEHIWSPLWDSRERIRIAAASAISACLCMLRQRLNNLEWYCRIYYNIHEGLKKGSVESIHGSLLVVHDMLQSTGGFMIPRFKGD